MSILLYICLHSASGYGLWLLAPNIGENVETFINNYHCKNNGELYGVLAMCVSYLVLNWLLILLTIYKEETGEEVD